MDKIETSLGPPLLHQQYGWEIDLTNLRVFRGLSVLSKIIGDEVIDQVENRPGDISILYKINSSINPELVEMKFTHIQIYSRAGILNDILRFRNEFQDHLRIVFGTFQNVVWAKKLHPEFYEDDTEEKTSKALIFPYHHTSANKDINYRFILERVSELKSPTEYSLRLTIEDFARANINIDSIPHTIVDDIDSRIYIEGSTRIAETVHNGILTACQRGQKSFIEEKRQYSQIFEQLARTVLGNLDQISLFWDDAFASSIVSREPSYGILMVKKIFLTLEDSIICSKLKEGERIKIDLGITHVYLDLSRLGRVLNFSFNRLRTTVNTEFYLERMPELHNLAKRGSHTHTFQEINIFLVHHITSEIIAMIEALRKLQTKSLDVVFVKYAGLVPPVYLDVLLDMPSSGPFMASLERKVTRDNRDYYSLSRSYSDVNHLLHLQEFMEKTTPDFFTAMKLLAGHLFLENCYRARENNEKVLLIEDGGYIAPFLMSLALAGKTTQEVFDEYLVNRHVEGNFTEFIHSTLIGSVEHTRNGYDRLLQVRKDHGRLLFPSYSIAISIQKTKEESKEVARSILNAVESILNGQGKILASRKILLLGASGNIGRYLDIYLESRLENPDTIKVDRVSSRDTYATIDEIPREEFLKVDLILGVIGKSILNEVNLEVLVMQGEKENLFFASGSTKTLEFTHLTDWLNKLVESIEPTINGEKVVLEFSRIIDPQSQIDQGGRVTIRSASGLKKNLYLLGDLSPINFLYYGVPTETMDAVISQLMMASLGMTAQFQTGTLPEPDLYAVDYEIDMWGNKI